MATGSSSNIPSFDEIMKRGSVTEPKNSRPVPHIRRIPQETELSLNSAVKTAKVSKKQLGVSMVPPASEPANPKKKIKKNKKGGNGSGLSSDGSPNQSRRRTPMTMPRTKFTAATPLEQKIALKRLKQRLNFDDQENAEVVAVNGDLGTAYFAGEAQQDDRESVTSSNMTSDNQLSELSEVDTNKINDRLLQVREYIKQATGMYLSLSMADSDEPKRTEQMGKLAKLIQQLRIQEQGYSDLLKKTLIEQDDALSNTERQSVTSTERSTLPPDEGHNDNVGDVGQQQQELDRLREQQVLLKKIVEQQKELQHLKDRQSTLLKMQENAEHLITEHRNLHTSTEDSVQNNSSQPQQQQRELSLSENEQSSVTVTDTENTESMDENTEERRLQLEHKLTSLHEKKQQMDELMETLKTLKNSQQVEANMRSVLNDDDLSEVASEVLAAAVAENGEDKASSTVEIEQKIDRLHDVRERLQELRSIVNDYETGNKTHQQVATTTDASKDNRLQAKNMRQLQQANATAVTGVGGARLRIPTSQNNQEVIMKDLLTLQTSIEELMDNRNRPIPQGIQKKNIDVTRNAPFKNKNTNQQKKQVNSPSPRDDYTAKLRELNHARAQFAGNLRKNAETTNPKNNNVSDMENLVSESSVKDSDLDSINSSTLQWQDDPEFQNKVKKLRMAKDKLNHLQQLVRVVQQGGGPHLPIDDLEDLTLTLSEEQVESEYGESEEEEDEERDEYDDEGNESAGEEDDGDEEQTDGDEQSVVSKSTDANFDLGSNNGLSDNERRYQGLLRKQRLELNYLLKERERLLQAQRKLSSLAGQSPSAEDDEGTQSSSKKRKPRVSVKPKVFPSLTKDEVRKQQKRKQNKKDDTTMRQLLMKMDDEQYYGSEQEFYPPKSTGMEQSDYKLPVAALSSPLAVNEIRRQRELFEQRKKQKFVEKQRRKNQIQNDEDQSDDRATYVINSDIDEGVGVSMYSADVTTAATWGGSTEQSSDDDDSAVGDEFPARETMENDDDGDANDDEYGSHFDQAEEEEELDGASAAGAVANGNVPPLFKVKKFDDEQPRSSMKWNQNMADKNRRGIGTVSWSLDISPPRSQKRPRQGNLTPAHKLMEDSKKRRFQKAAQKESEVPPSSKPITEVHSQLATICSSLLRNEQTLLQMLQNQMMKTSTDNAASNFEKPRNSNNAISEIQEFFSNTNSNESFSQTLYTLRTAYERIEQHQLDMEYLRQQFERVMHPAQQAHRSMNAEATDPRSSWQNEPPSLHFSSFGPPTTFDTPTQTAGGEHQQRGLFQKETQTETTLFEDPFRSSIQQYRLFGEPKDEENEANPQPRNYDFTDMEPTSPGVVGDRNFIGEQYHQQQQQLHQQQQEQESADDVIDDEMFPYRLRVSEYNPLSYQGNFADTRTGNVMTVSKMSMSKKRAETNSCETSEKSIWPSFFKLTDNAEENSEQHQKQEEEEALENSPNHPNSFPGQTTSNEPPARVNERKVDQNTASGDESNFSLFEALRDSIYSEVATLIAMNESRPHYLIELFRELQLLNSDYLRQRALYSLQELVTRYLTDENTSTSKSAFKKETIPTSGNAYEQWIPSASEQTPSESVMTTDDDESESQALQTLTKQIHNNEMYDYAELVESQSEGNTSTPSSHHDAPFATEDLGNTVINLEDALHKMRTYEANMAEAKKAFEQISNSVRESTPNNTASQQAAYETIKRRLNTNLDTVSNSSAGDVNSEASSDIQQPSVDTQKLDRQIKAVMMDLIPFLNENINETCTEEFLDKIRSLIVEFAKEKEPGSEEEQFSRFFHSQLDSILKDSLMKFNARRLKECGEDILIDVSEILFNELAFFKLMQDLDRPLCGTASAEYSSQHHTSDHSKMPFVNQSTMYDDSSAAESADAQEGDDDEEEEIPVCKASASASSVNTSSVSTSSSNAFVMIDPMEEVTDEETESSRQFVKVELSVSETRPVRSSGSGEEDNDEEPSIFSTVPTPVSSIHTYSQAAQNVLTSGQGTVNVVQLQSSVEHQDGEQIVEDDRDEGDRDAQEDERSEHEREAGVNIIHDNDDESVENDGAEGVENDGAEGQRDEGLLYRFDDMSLGESDQAQRNDRPETAQQQNDTEEVEEDDLPEADMVSEENVAIAQVVLNHLEGQQELAGDPIALPAPTANENVAVEP